VNDCAEWIDLVHVVTLLYQNLWLSGHNVQSRTQLRQNTLCCTVVYSSFKERHMLQPGYTEVKYHAQVCTGMHKDEMQRATALLNVAAYMSPGTGTRKPRSSLYTMRSSCRLEIGPGESNETTLLVNSSRIFPTGHCARTL